jgi:hypothetical protein
LKTTDRGQCLRTGSRSSLDAQMLLRTQRRRKAFTIQDALPPRPVS